MTATRKALTYVELDVPYCALTYATSPCAAELGVTGADRCYNTLKTCQDTANIDLETVTLRFAAPAEYLPASIPAIACLAGIDFTPGTISLGEDLGSRAVVKVTLDDLPWPDTAAGFDKYHAQRSYDPFTQGTLFGKFRARQPYLRGRELRVIRGEVGEALGAMETRTYVVDSLEGPGTDGRFTIIAKDVLKLASGDRAQAPALSNGRLAGDIASGATSASLTPSGIGDDEYPASGLIAIGGKEIVAFTRSGDTLTITRAQNNTEAQAHSTGDRCQLCLGYTAQTAAYIAEDLLTTYAGVSSSFVPTSAWAAEMANYLPVVYTGLVAEPTSVAELLSELVAQAGLAFWWDDVEASIRLQVLRGIPTSAAGFSEENTIRGSLKVSDQPAKQVTQVWVYFAQINPLRPLDETDNYRSSEVRVGPLESSYGTPQIRKVFSRWIPSGGRAVAQRLGDIVLSRFQNPPRRFALSVFRDNVVTPAAGAGYRVKSWVIQDAAGAATTAPVQLTRIRPDAAAFALEAEEMLFDQVGDLTPGVNIIDAALNDVNARALSESIWGVAAAGDELDFIIEAGVIVGSTSTATGGLICEGWPTVAVTGDTTDTSPVITGLSVDTAAAGFAPGMFVRGAGIPADAKILTVDSASQITLDKNATATASGVSLTVYTVIVNVEIRGRVQGKGGPGGLGGPYTGASSNPGVPGGAGGPAMVVTYPINLTSAAGEIWSGGGGGGGGGNHTGVAAGGGGGGGGAGTQGGVGSVATYGSNPGGPGIDGTSEAGGAGGLAGSGSDRVGGAGGGPGLNGSAGVGVGSQAGGAGGSKGNAIDGDTWITYLDTPGDVRGTTV